MCTSWSLRSTLYMVDEHCCVRDERTSPEQRWVGLGLRVRGSCTRIVRRDPQHYCSVEYWQVKRCPHGYSRRVSGKNATTPPRPRITTVIVTSSHVTQQCTAVVDDQHLFFAFMLLAFFFRSKARVEWSGKLRPKFFDNFRILFGARHWFCSRETCDDYSSVLSMLDVWATVYVACPLDVT